MSITPVPISMRLVRAPTAASSGNGEPSCCAKGCTRKNAPSAPSSSAATARSIDCSSASDPKRVCEWGEDDQWPKDKKPIFFMQPQQRPAAEPSCQVRSAGTTSACPRGPLVAEQQQDDH